MTTEFNGLELKLLRQFNELSLEDLGSKLDCDYTRQYLHKVETGQTLPNDQFIDKVAHYFNVSQSFFMQQKPVLQEDQIHFRSNRTAKVSFKLSCSLSFSSNLSVLTSLFMSLMSKHPI